MYELMFILLLSLATATCALLLPFPPSTRRTLVRAIDQSSLTAACQGYIKFIPAAALSAWVYTLLEVTRAQSRLDSAADGASVRHESALHRAQRDSVDSMARSRRFAARASVAPSAAQPTRPGRLGGSLPKRS